MAKLTLPTATAAGLTVRERVLLYCAASGTDWQQHAGVTGEQVTTMVVKGLISRDAGGQIAAHGSWPRRAAGDAAGPMMTGDRRNITHVVA